VAVVQYTYTRKQYIEQHKKYIEQHKNLEECGPCPVFAGFYPGICLTTEEKYRKNLSQNAILFNIAPKLSARYIHDIHMLSRLHKSCNPKL